MFPFLERKSQRSFQVGSEDGSGGLGAADLLIFARGIGRKAGGFVECCAADGF